MFNEVLCKRIRDRETNCWTISMTMFHVIVRTISRMEDYMIPYLKDRLLIRSELTASLRATIANRIMHVYIVTRLIQVGDCWNSV